MWKCIEMTINDMLIIEQFDRMTTDKERFAELQRMHTG
jgi:hypothetical protein